MKLRLDKVLFNHAATTGAIKIRRNETQKITLPEWQFGVSHLPEDSPVAYLSAQVPNVIVIKASFYRDDHVAGELEIQAVASANDALGNVSKAPVKFNPDGYSDLVPFNLLQAQIANWGVGASTTTWDWQYYAPEEDKWASFDESSHRIYTVFGVPTDPWDKELPWSEVLEHACTWAAGAKNEVQAATSITKEVYALGKAKTVTYTSAPTYAHDTFNCTAFLRLLRDGVGSGQTVNCDDCATIVSTFSNILGCDLSQSSMGKQFHTNYVIPIGKQKWTWTGFAEHAAAWKDPCGAEDRLYDAFLLLDGDGNPGKGGLNPDDHQPLTPANLLFGEKSDKKNYRFCLVRSGDGNARPNTRVRRPLRKSYFGKQSIIDWDYEAFLKGRFEFDSWPPHKGLDQATQTVVVSDLLINYSAFASWTSREPEDCWSEASLTIKQVFLLRQERNPEKLVTLNIYECTAATSPCEFLLQLLGQFHLLDVKRQLIEPVGDVSFVKRHETAVVFKHGKFVAAVRSVGKQAVSTLEMAKAVDAYLSTLNDVAE